MRTGGHKTAYKIQLECNLETIIQRFEEQIFSFIDLMARIQASFGRENVSRRNFEGPALCCINEQMIQILTSTVNRMQNQEICLIVHSKLKILNFGSRFLFKPTNFQNHFETCIEVDWFATRSLILSNFANPLGAASLAISAERP